jgi:hypothetical protein
VRLFVHWPGSWFIAATFLAFPWAIAAAGGLTPYGAWIPFALTAGGLLQSLWTREETVDLRLELERDAGPEPRRYTEALGAPAEAGSQRPLTIVQITDPHLGPFMSVARLRRICQRAVDQQPDLILVTGDLMTMESHDVDTVARAIEPLRAYEGRVFACHGNHDHEAREVVRRAYARAGVRLLVDEAVTVDTAAGPVQVLGLDFTWRHREAHMQMACEEHPREPGRTHACCWPAASPSRCSTRSGRHTRRGLETSRSSRANSRRATSRPIFWPPTSSFRHDREGRIRRSRSINISGRGGRSWRRGS